MKRKAKKQLGRVIVNAIGSFLCCSLVLGVSMIFFSYGLNMTEEMFRHRAMLTLSNIVFLSMLFTAQDVLRSWYGEKRQVRRIMKGVEAITKGDFSYRIEPFHRFELFNQYDEIIDGINKMAKELESSETMKKDFISNVSHELKTPLSTISAYCEILQDPSLSEEERNERIAMILKNVKKLSNLISNILKLNKLENQEIYPEKKPFDLSARVASAFLSFVDVSEEKGIILNASVKDDVMIVSDPELLDIVWNNLIGNAVKFTPSGGKISVVSEEDESEVRVYVSDTGVGISRDAVSHIFDRFYQADTSHQTEGNGLGLALVERVVEIVGGEISVESEEGKGTVFQIKLKKDSESR